jgi:formate hydrogenlyase transcriptional activator
VIAEGRVPLSEEVIGTSSALNEALASAKQLAVSDAAVLIAGERGSGKELFARVIHRASRRRKKSFVQVDCVTTARELLERELFGFEKGAFDGAVSNEIGGLEMADKGTLFLNEIARFPLDIQPKLVHLLERGEFERLGRSRILRVNVRFIAATRHDIAKWIAGNRFRQDLYDQFNTSLIRIPPLRERREDIPLLVHYFTQRFARRINKDIQVIAPETISVLLNYDWPGNVTQLEHFIQRSVILTEGPRLQAPLEEL